MSSGLTVNSERSVAAGSVNVAVVDVAGHLDVATAPEVRAVLYKTLADQPSAIVVDVTGLTADDVALTMFAAVARSAAAWPGCAILLCGARAELRARLRAMAIDRAVVVYPTRAEALAAAGALPPPLRFDARLAATLDAARMARDVVARACVAWHLERFVDDAEMVITELAGNAVRHGSGDLVVTVVLRDRYLHLSVRDGSPRLPRLTLPDVDTSEGGRGLLLVDAVAAGWGSLPVPGGKVVWATLRRRG